MLLSPIQTKAGMLSPDGVGKVDAQVAIASLGGTCDASLACPDSAAGKTDEAPSAPPCLMPGSSAHPHWASALTKGENLPGCALHKTE